MSRTQQILNHLKSGKKISTMQAFREWGETNLRSRISELRSVINIQDEWAGEGQKRFKKYYL